MPQNEAPKLIIEPLDPLKHDRAAFSCGIEQVDNFFQKTANKLQKSDNVRVFVMTQDAGPVMGFYAINSHAVDYLGASEKVRPRPARTWVNSHVSQ